MAKSYRKERITETIKEILSETLLSGIKDPRVGFVTITSVRVAQDMTSAKVHFSGNGRRGTARRQPSRDSSARVIICAKLLAPSSRYVTPPSFGLFTTTHSDKSFRIEKALRDAGLGGERTA